MTRPGPYRLASGGRINRQKPVPFTFNGKTLYGSDGDTLASALLATGCRIVSRSFKFHRPRGVFSAGVEEPNAIVELHGGARSVPQARATLVPLMSHLAANSQTGWPNSRVDALRLLDCIAPVLAAGFYNKTFLWPNWHAYEPFVRQLAGGGNTPTGPDPDRYELRNAHCDVLVVGGGVSGLTAAEDAASAGARVVVVEQESALGGRSRWDGRLIDGFPGDRWVAAAVARMKALKHVRLMTGTAAVGYYNTGVVALAETPDCSSPARESPRERFWVVRTKLVVLATGAIEQPLVFANNDRPGIMLAGAARRYLREFGVAAGRRVMVATNNDSAYATAIDLNNAGINVIGICDSRSTTNDALLAALHTAAIPHWPSTIPVDTIGFGALKAAKLGRLTGDKVRVEHCETVACDALLVSGGWNPLLHLYSQAGGTLGYRDDTGALEATETLPSVELVGSARGYLAAGAATRSTAVQSDTRLTGARIGIRVCPTGNPGRQWVDLRHDVTVADLQLAVRENFSSIEHVKRYTTVGMAVDQGKTSATVAIEVVAHLRHISASAIGHTTLRPPFVPVTMGAIAGAEIGKRFAPSRCTPLHEWHEQRGAIFHDYGEWHRAAAYPTSGESIADAISREQRTVRTGVGLFDGSPLGKIEVHGPDALEFLDHFYVSNLSTLKPYRARYSLMLNESGVVFDDGTITLLDQNHAIVTTTSGNAEIVAAWLEEWHQCEWPNFQVAIIPVTDQWSTIALTGIHARAVLSRLRPDIDISNSAFPHLGVRVCHLLGRRTRIYRVSFSGELTYEINTPADTAQEIWEALISAGESDGLVPYGVEALLALRLEKGFLHIGSDTDGSTIPDDVGWGTVATNKRSDFIGKRSLYLPANQRTDRLQLVGLAGVNDHDMVAGSHIRLRHLREITDGWVTSRGRSGLSNRPIALGLVRAGRANLGATIDIYDAGRVVNQARITSLPFFDRAGERMNG
jgi:sarcosine oxidase, subunit alpha